MSNDHATAMTGALDVAQKITTVCRRRQVPIPQFEIEVSEFAGADATIHVSWQPAWGGDPVDIALISEVFIVKFGKPIQGSAATEWIVASDTLDGITVEYTIFTK